MRKQPLIAVTLLGLVAALAGMAVLPQKSAHAQIVGGPLPPVPTPPNLTKLEPIEQLGKDMLYDTTMSDPSGYACAQCHAPSTGFTSGLESIVNLRGGPQPGVVPGRFGPRRPYTYPYAAFSPEGPYYDTQNAVWIGGNFWDGAPPTPPSRPRAPRLTPTR